LDRMDEVLQEIPRVREDLGFIPLVTPTSQIVGTQAVLNVVAGERYKNIPKETAGILKGEYGATPAPVNAELQSRVLAGEAPLECRPADLLQPELERLTAELKKLTLEDQVKLAAIESEDVLTYALFPQVGWRFLQNRGNPSVFEPAPGSAACSAQVVAERAGSGGAVAYTVTVNGRPYQVEVAPGGAITQVQRGSALGNGVPPAVAGTAELVKAPMTGHILRINVKEGQYVEAGQVVIVMEAMKMETEVRARHGGTVSSIAVKVSDSVAANDVLVTLS
jgi:oxaloacetate decarboxylase (Na+ extruding) subunit alpha